MSPSENDHNGPVVAAPSAATTAVSQGPSGYATAVEGQRTSAPREIPRSHEPSVTVRVACFAFGIALVATVAVVGTFLHAERSALRRTDADVVGLLADRTTRSIATRMERSDGALGTSTFEMLRDEVASLVEARGVTQVALTLAGGDDVIAAQSPEISRATGGAILPMPQMDGAGRTLGPDHLIVARAFRLRPSDSEDALLVVKSSYPMQTSQMRDLIALAGRSVGLVALFLAFLSPLLARVLLRGVARGARAVRAGETPVPGDFHGVGAEIVDLVTRISSDDERIRKAELGQRQLTEAARDRLKRLREEADAHRLAADNARKEARSATAAKAAFVANTSHEIRTPLHAVLGTASLMLDTDLDEEQRALANRSIRASETLLSLVDDVLDLARFDAREIVMKTDPFRPADLVESVAELAGSLAATKGLEVAAFCSPECPETLIGDPDRIRQALMRLVDNAIKFTDAGEITIDVAWEASEDGVPRAVFSVSDTGLGIGDDERARLFQAFEQLDASNTRRHGGVGLGLALVARIARNAHGEVRLESRRGRGSRFSLAMPLPIDPSEARSLGQRVLERERPLEGLRVLVLDDAEAGARLFGRTLELMGATTHIEASTYAGFEAFMRTRADVVFIDAKLPGRDAFLGALESGDHSAPVPVVLMTPAVAGKMRGESGDEAVSAMIAKPLARRDVEEVTLRVLGRSTRADQEEAEERRAGERRKALLESHMRRRIRILLVEDNKTNQQLVQYVLGKRGYQIDVASNGRRAVDAFGAGVYDAILMDCQMPEMDGYEATRRIRGLEEPRGKRTPILAMTASVLDSDRDKCLHAGMDDMIGKPFQPHRMVTWLEGWLLRSLYGDELGAAPITGADAPVEPQPQDPIEGLVAVPADPGATPLQASSPIARTTGAALPAFDGLEAVNAPLPVSSEASPLRGVEDPPRLVLDEGALSDTQPTASLPTGPSQFDESEVTAAVDTDVLRSLLDDEEGRILANELIDSFLTVAPEKLAGLERAIECQDLTSCAALAHELVSTSGTVGATRLAYTLREVERFASRGNGVDSGLLVQKCREEIEVARFALVRAVGR